MRNRLVIYVLLFLVFSWTISCKKEDVSSTSIQMGYAYFPVNKGHTIIYDVDSVYIDTKVSINETIHYQLKEHIESEFLDNTNRLSHRVVRFIRNSDTSAWVIKNVFSATLTRTTAERIEDNQQYIKLIFPVKENSTWMGNSHTTLPEWEYEYTGVDEKYSKGAIKFDSTVTVTQINEQNLIEKHFAVETYAKHVGMIYKQSTMIDRTPSGAITKAVSNTYKFKSYIP